MPCGGARSGLQRTVCRPEVPPTSRRVPDRRSSIRRTGTPRWTPPPPPDLNALRRRTVWIATNSVQTGSTTNITQSARSKIIDPADRDASMDTASPSRSECLAAAHGLDCNEQCADRKYHQHHAECQIEDHRSGGPGRLDGHRLPLQI